MNDGAVHQHFHLSANLGRLRRLIRKELAEILRDRRTIITLVLMPVLLYPLLTIAFQQFLLGHRLENGVPRYEIGFQTKAEAKFFMQILSAGQEALRREGVLQPAAATEGAEPKSWPPHAIPAPEFNVSHGTNLREALMNNAFDVVVIHRGDGLPDMRPDRNIADDWELLYREESAPGLEAVRYLRRIVAAANGQFLAVRLASAGVLGQRSDPIRLVPEAIQEVGPKKPTTLAAMVPLILILMTITGAVYPAIDLTAGERERGTLEVLVAAPIPRFSVLFAKYVAVLTVAMLTACVNIGTMTVTLWVTGIGSALFGGQGLGPLVFVEILALLFLFAAFFSAVLLALTSFARSFKEAQAYLIPLMLMSLAPGMIGLVPGIQLEGLFAVAPLVNVVLLARDLIAGNASAVMAAVVVVTTLLYAVAALGVAARVFGAEAVLYSQSSSWGDLFRRPSRPREFPEASSALLCLALMFPVYFLLTYSQAYLGEQPLAVVSFVSMLANIFLFVAFPMVSLYLGRVRLSTALALARPGFVACASALLLGLFLWPLTHELTAFLRSLGLATLRPEHLAKVSEGLARWRQLSPLVVLISIAGVTPLLEELFFRGYLFGALSHRTRPSTAIVSTAILFGLFHLFLPFGMALERLIPTTLMGALLGWVRWRGGSVWPGMLLHVAHNGLVVLLGYYQPRLETAGWIVPEMEYLPGWWVLIALAGSGLGAWGMIETKRAAETVAAP